MKKKNKFTKLKDKNEKLRKEIDNLIGIEYKIEITSKEIVAETISQEVMGTINGKEFGVIRTKGFQKDIGETDNDFMFFNDTLTDEEQEEVEEYIKSEVKF